MMPVTGLDRECASSSSVSDARVFLIGAGPGAVDLLTLRAASAIKAADIIFYDSLVSPEVLALSTGAKKVHIGKRCGRNSATQEFINRSLVSAARRYGQVVRLKGGDPMIYGRAQEEIAALTAAGVSYEIIPGVSAAFGASADLGVSLTKRGVSRSVVFVTPSFGNGETPHDWVDAVIHADTAVLYMASRDSGKIARTLMDAGVPINLPVVVVENATLEHRQIIPTVLSDLPMVQGRLGEGPALILIGEVYEEFVQTALSSAPSGFGIALAV